MDYKELANILAIDIDKQFIKIKQQEYLPEYGINTALQLAYRDAIIDEFSTLQIRVDLMWRDWAKENSWPIKEEKNNEI